MEELDKHFIETGTKRIITGMDEVDHYVVLSSLLSKIQEGINCEFCKKHEQGESLIGVVLDDYNEAEFEFVEDIKFCPLCGSILRTSG